MKKNNSIQEWIPFEKILENGIIKLKDNSYIKIIKIYPINFNLKSELEKEAILNSYKILPLYFINQVERFKYIQLYNQRQRNISEILSNKFMRLSALHAAKRSRIFRLLCFISYFLRPVSDDPLLCGVSSLSPAASRTGDRRPLR